MADPSGARFFLPEPPSLGGNAALLALYAATLLAATWLGAKHKDVLFSTTLTLGLFLEVLGYIGRMLMARGSINGCNFALFLLGTILGANFTCAALCSIMPQIMGLFGDEFRGWRPAWYTPIFFTLGLASIALEIAGGVFATLEDAPEQMDTGLRVLAVGLAVQLVSLAIFVFHSFFFIIAVRTSHHDPDVTHAHIRNRGAFKGLIAGLVVTTLLLALRTAFRIVSVSEGFASPIAGNEALILCLDGSTVLIANCILLVLFPPRILGQPKSVISENPGRLLKPRPQPIQLGPHEPPPYERSYYKASIAENRPPRHSPYIPQPSPQHNNLVDSDVLW